MRRTASCNSLPELHLLFSLLLHFGLCLSIDLQVLLDLEYEDSDDDSVTRSTAYCGRQSYGNPAVIWEGDRYRTSIYTHVSYRILLTAPQAMFAQSAAQLVTLFWDHVPRLAL